MAHRVAFLRRPDGWLVCATCANFHREDDGAYCMDDRIRYDPAVYGCSMYGSGDNEDEWNSKPELPAIVTRTVRQARLGEWCRWFSSSSSFSRASAHRRRP